MVGGKIWEMIFSVVQTTISNDSFSVENKYMQMSMQNFNSRFLARLNNIFKDGEEQKGELTLSIPCPNKLSFKETFWESGLTQASLREGKEMGFPKQKKRSYFILPINSTHLQAELST